MKSPILFALLLVTVGSAQAGERRIPLTSSDMPFSARIERGLIHTDGEWAAIAFYRPPVCVPADFDLLAFFDLAAFECCPPQPYLEGFAILGPVGPIQSKVQLARDQTMPVWFVSWLELEAAMADDDLTMSELQDLPSLLEGEATFYTETLHPYEMAQQTMTSIVASGWLADGGTFSYQATETHNTLRHVKIEFE